MAADRFARLAWVAMLVSALVVAAARAEAPSSGESHWAFQPPARPAIPAVRGAHRVRTPVDAFLLAQLEAHGLTFTPDADRLTLNRRASLDLLGLPPALEDVDAFLADGRPDAYERLLDRLLASPHFGERWGRHWLDVVGYADTVGFDTDANTLVLSAGKWRYRDYVIAAFNSDKPYDRFVTEQLAGDEMDDWRNATTFTPAIRERLIATGYLRTARDQTHEPESNIPLCYYGVLHDTVAIVGNSLLGLTLQCSQCHDHKFDPISQTDYYRLMAVFTPAYNPRDWRAVYPWKPGIRDRGLPDIAPAEVAAAERHNREINRQVADLRGRRADLRRPYETRLRGAKLRTLPEPIRADTQAALATPAQRRTEVQKYLAGKFEATLRVEPAEVEAALSTLDRAAVQQVNAQLLSLEGHRRSFGTIQALYDVGPPPPTHRLKRGQYATPAEEVSPGLLGVLTDAGKPEGFTDWPVAAKTSGRRTALARRLTEPGSRAAALLARVMVNRVWQHVFGQGLVATPENFGRSGAAPTHPELLEWLSIEFAAGGWRIKPLLKLLMMSTAYRQASRSLALPAGLDPATVDPADRLLWRQRLRRLEAEAVRDSVLAVSGRLNPILGGPPVLLQAMPDGRVVIGDHQGGTSAQGRRSVYLLSRRAYNLSLLTVFDQPLVAVNCPCRDASAVPLQALTMLNDPFIAEHAQHFADRVARTAGVHGGPAVAAAFRLALTRPPTDSEAALCIKLLEEQAALFRSAGQNAPDAEGLALVQLCHTLLNTSEFLYAE
jgi:hypothetical protein